MNEREKEKREGKGCYLEGSGINDYGSGSGSKSGCPSSHGGSKSGSGNHSGSGNSYTLSSYSTVGTRYNREVDKPVSSVIVSTSAVVNSVGFL